MQARITNQDEEIRQLRQQVQSGNSGYGESFVAVAVDNSSHWEALYERFSKQEPPTLLGGADRSQAEQWMSRITSNTDFMRVT